MGCARRCAGPGGGLHRDSGLGAAFRPVRRWRTIRRPRRFAARRIGDGRCRGTGGHRGREDGFGCFPWNHAHGRLRTGNPGHSAHRLCRHFPRSRRRCPSERVHGCPGNGGCRRLRHRRRPGNRRCPGRHCLRCRHHSYCRHSCRVCCRRWGRHRRRFLHRRLHGRRKRGGGHDRRRCSAGRRIRAGRLCRCGSRGPGCSSTAHRRPGNGPSCRRPPCRCSPGGQPAWCRPSGRRPAGCGPSRPCGPGRGCRVPAVIGPGDGSIRRCRY